MNSYKTERPPGALHIHKKNTGSEPNPSLAEISSTTLHTSIIKMIPRSNSCFLSQNETTVSSSQQTLGYVAEGRHGRDPIEPGGPNPGCSTSEVIHLSTLLYSLSILKKRVYQAESLVSLLASPPSGDHQLHADEPTSSMSTMARVSTLIQEIVSVSSSMLFTFQQMSLNPTKPSNGGSYNVHNQACPETNIARDESRGIQNQEAGQAHKQEEIAGSRYILASNDHHHQQDEIVGSWFGCGENPFTSTTTGLGYDNSMQQGEDDHEMMIIEMDAADLLAKYTHYCQVCGKGFKRDANLRMHMRAHGDEYKSSAALTNPAKNHPNSAASFPKVVGRRYSCPQDGCRWNSKHPKFQPLKSMICVKNHYKRSHCPKMYMCKRCNQKQFSVLSDLRTHEKHCGDLKWRCSCGTTFSRKDKLLGHVGLFVGHVPVTGFSSHTLS